MLLRALLLPAPLLRQQQLLPSDAWAALAAVGYGGFMLFVAQAIILGMSTGVQATASRRKGQVMKAVNSMS